MSMPLWFISSPSLSMHITKNWHLNLASNL